MDYTMLKSDCSLDATIRSTNTSSEFNDFKSSEMNVTFHNIKLLYEITEQFRVHFSVFSQSYEMKDEDCVGICRFPDSSFLVSKYISECVTDSELENLEEFDLLAGSDKIIAKKTFFKMDGLLDPANESADSCFHFVYKNASGIILGQSTPFQIKNFLDSNIPSSEERPDEDDFIVVRSQESFLKERVEHLTNSNTLLEYLIRSNEKEFLQKEKEAKDLKSELDNAKLKIVTMKEEFQNSIRDLEKAKADEKLSEMAKLEAKFAEERFNLLLLLKEENVKKSVNPDKEMREKMERMKQENDELKSKLASALNERRTLMEEKSSFENSQQCTDHLKSLIRELEGVIENQTLELSSLKKELEEKLHLIEDLKANSSSDLSNYYMICKELLSQNDGLKAKMESDQLVYTKKNQDLILKNDKLNAMNIELRARLEQAKINFGTVVARQQANRKTLSSKHLEEPLKLPLPSHFSSVLESDKEASFKSIDQALLDLENAEFVEQIKPSAPPADQVGEEEQTVAKSVAPEVQVAAESSATATTVPKMKASVVVSLPCTMCKQVIDCVQLEDDSGQMYEMVEHFENVHHQKMCPICSVLFDTKLPIFKSYFSSHIQNHLNNMKYPAPSAPNAKLV